MPGPWSWPVSAGVRPPRSLAPGGRPGASGLPRAGLWYLRDPSGGPLVPPGVFAAGQRGPDVHMDSDKTAPTPPGAPPGAHSRGMLIAGRFAIEDLAGRGGMGTVYRATDCSTGLPVALKLLHSLTSQQAAMRFNREAVLLAGLSHPGIVSYVAHGTADGNQPFLAMEWLEGEDLARRLLRQPLGLPETLSLLRRAAEALTAAHRQGIVHRDIKPSNLFLRAGRPEDVVVLDFGLARQAVPTLMGVTGIGTVVGTPGYMAPEQASSQQEIPPAADIFSLGCVLYECITGKPPFEAPHFAAALAKILFADPAPLHTLRPGLPAGLQVLVDRMLAKDPKWRLPDADSLLKAISALDSVPELLVPRTELELRLHSMAGAEQKLVSVLLASFGVVGHERGDAGLGPGRRPARFVAHGALGLRRPGGAAGGRLAGGHAGAGARHGHGPGGTGGALCPHLQGALARGRGGADHGPGRVQRAAAGGRGHGPGGAAAAPARADTRVLLRGAGRCHGGPARAGLPALAPGPGHLPVARRAAGGRRLAPAAGQAHAVCGPRAGAGPAGVLAQRLHRGARGPGPVGDGTRRGRQVAAAPRVPAAAGAAGAAAAGAAGARRPDEHGSLVRGAGPGTAAAVRHHRGREPGDAPPAAVPACGPASAPRWWPGRSRSSWGSCAPCPSPTKTAPSSRRCEAIHC